MSRSGSQTLFDEAGPRVLEALVAGASAADAARAHGVSQGAVKGWLARGREDPGSRYGSFACEVDAARAGRRLSTRRGLVGERETLELLGAAARAGSVPALRELLRWHRERRRPLADGHPLDELDELAARRRRPNDAPKAQ